MFYGPDKYDYLETDNHNFQFEYNFNYYTKSPFLQDLTGEYNSINVGVNLFYNSPSEKAKKTIPWGGPNNPKPTNKPNIRPRVVEIGYRNRPAVGFFLGFNGPSFGLSPGVTISGKLVEEEDREKYCSDNQIVNNKHGCKAKAPGGKWDTYKVSGRGMLLTGISALPNAKMRIGGANSFHFKILFLQEQFTVVQDALQVAFYIPISKWYGFELGNGLYPHATLFHRSLIHIYNVSICIKLSVVLSYYSTKLKKVAVEDSFFGNFGLEFNL
jgi:hypothetical protein